MCCHRDPNLFKWKKLDVFEKVAKTGTDLNEGDQRGYNQSNALSQDCRQLVAEGLSCSSGHAHKHISVTYRKTKQTRCYTQTQALCVNIQKKLPVSSVCLLLRASVTV